MMSDKRKLSDHEQQQLIVKKQKVDSTELVVTSTTALIAAEKKDYVRTSTLPAPTMELTGHASAVLTVQFSTSGHMLCSGGHDASLFLWSSESCANVAAVKGHTAAIVDSAWARDDTQVYTASADTTAAVWDVESETRIKRCRHSDVVNSVCASRRGEQTVITASDDCTLAMWDLRSKAPALHIEDKFQLLSCAYNDDSTQVFAGGIENVIKCWDVRSQRVLYELEGHKDSITGLRLSHAGSHLLSNGMDGVLHSWDVRPFVSGPSRLVQSYTGATHDVEQNLLRCAWGRGDQLIAAGSADRLLNIWDAKSGDIMYCLPGHKGSINQVDFHPTQPIVASCSSDKKIIVGEIQ